MKKKFSFEDLLFKGLPLWLVLILTIFGILGSFVFAYSAQYYATGGRLGGAVTRMLHKLSGVPHPFFVAIREVASGNPQIFPYDGQPGFVFSDPTLREEGYLLASAYDETNKISTIFLYELSSQKLIKEWVPNMDQIHALSSFRGELNIQKNYRAQHPLLTTDGGVLVTSGEGPLVKLGADSQVEWAIDRGFHHSIEKASEDQGYWVPIVMEGSPITNRFGREVELTMRNDGIALVSPDGRILKEQSITQILLNAGFAGILYGVGQFETDRIHLNDIEEILTTDKFVQAGDLMLSVRNLSSVLLYRPSTEKVVWLQTGPFLNQHDIDYLGQGRFAIFGNDNIRSGELLEDNPVRGVHPYSSAWVYDVNTNKTDRVLEFQKAAVVANAQGRQEFLENGDVFVDDAVRAMRISPSGEVRWTYTHHVGDGRVGALHWCRYLTKFQIPDIIFQHQLHTEL